MLSPAGTCIVVWTVASVDDASWTEVTRVGFEDCAAHLAISTSSLRTLSLQACFSMKQLFWYSFIPPWRPQTGSTSLVHFSTHSQAAKPVNWSTLQWRWAGQVWAVQGSANARSRRRSKITRLGIKQTMRLVFKFLYPNKWNLRELIVSLMIKSN